VLCVYRHAHDPRIQVAAFNHASTYFADVVWHGQSTRHIREGLEPPLTSRTCAMFGEPSARWFTSTSFRAGRAARSSFMRIRHDVLAEFSEQVVEEFKKHNLDHKAVVLPCGITPWERLRTNTWMGGSW